MDLSLFLYIYIYEGGGDFSFGRYLDPVDSALAVNRVCFSDRLSSSEVVLRHGIHLTQWHTMEINELDFGEDDFTIEEIFRLNTKFITLQRDRRSLSSEDTRPPMGAHNIFEVVEVLDGTPTTCTMQGGRSNVLSSNNFSFTPLSCDLPQVSSPW